MYTLNRFRLTEARSRVMLSFIILFASACTYSAKPNQAEKQTVASETKQPTADENKPAKVQKMILPEFDIVRFNKNKDETESFKFVNELGETIDQFGDETGYHEQIKKDGVVFEGRRSYHPNGKIKVIGNVYPNSFPIGVWRYFDDNGNPVRTVDHDLGYAFGWEEIKKMCEEKRIKLSANTTTIGKEVKHGLNVWILTYHNTKAGLTRLTLDGANGAMLQEEFLPIEK